MSTHKTRQSCKVCSLLSLALTAGPVAAAIIHMNIIEAQQCSTKVHLIKGRSSEVVNSHLSSLLDRIPFASQLRAVQGPEAKR